MEDNSVKVSYLCTWGKASTVKTVRTKTEYDIQDIVVAHRQRWLCYLEGKTNCGQG